MLLVNRPKNGYFDRFISSCDREAFSQMAVIVTFYRLRENGLPASLISCPFFVPG